jgi:VWFA-related protein
MSALPKRILFALLGLAGAVSQAQQTPVIQVETRTVLVDAVVTGKKGDYVHDLTAKDFHIWQDGKEQEITSLSSDAKSPEPHFLVLFFDATRMAAQDQAQARRSAARFIDANAGPGSQMAIVSYNGSLRIAQNFTDNAGRLKDALNRMEASTSVTAASSGRPDRRDRSAAMTAAADNLGSRGAMESLGNLVKSLGVLPGRKTLVLLTGGISSSPDMKSAVTAAIEDSSRSGVAVYPVNVQPISVAVDATSVNPQMLGRRGGGGGSHADDSSQDPAASSQPLLMALANGTGGFLTRDSSELLAALQQIGEEQTEHYVLSYTPPESKEGSCHALRVKVDRAGATVRARASYCATAVADLIADTPVAKDLESRAAGAGTGDLTASVQLPYFYVSAGVARVHLAMEISLGALKFENQKGKLHAEVNLLGIASAGDGGVGARFSDTLKLDYDTPAEVDKLKTTPVHYEKDFKIAPGKYSLAVAFGSGAANPGNTGFGKIEVPLNVEPWDGSELAVSGVALSRETHPAGDLGLTSLVEDRTPLVAQGAQFIPFGSNQFAKSDPGFFYMEVYDPDPASVGVRVRVADRKSGESKWDSGVIKLPIAGNAGRQAIPAGASLQLNTLAAGLYQLEITASDSAGKEVKRTADFEVK